MRPDDVPCDLLVHPSDAAGFRDGDRVLVRNAHGELVATARLTEDIAPGVVSLPHGRAEPNVNRLLDPALRDPASGTAVLSGVPVEVCAIRR